MARPRRAYPGQALVEYSMIIAFVCLGCIAAINYLQKGVSTAYEAQQESLAEPTFSASNYIPPATMTMTPTRTPTFAPTPTRSPTPLATPSPSPGTSPTPSPTPLVPSSPPPSTAPAATATVPPPTATTVPTATATTRPPTATATTVPPTATTVPTATATVNTATKVTITAAIEGDARNNQGTHYWVQLNNTGSTAVSGLSARLYINLTEVFAAGYTANDVTTNAWWDECGSAQLGAVTVADAARRIYYIPITWQGQTLNAGEDCQLKFMVRMAGWQNSWNGANDPSWQGLGTGGLSATTAIPVYRNGTKVYGNEP